MGHRPAMVEGYQRAGTVHGTEDEVASTFVTLLRGVPFDEGEDPGEAPSAGGKWAARPARPYTLRRAVQNMVWMYVAGLVFLPFSFSGLAGLEGTDLAAAIVIVAAISLCFVGSAVVADAGLAVRIGYVLFQLGLIASSAVYAGWHFTGFGVYLSIMIAALVPWRFSRWALLAWNIFVFVTALMLPAPGLLVVPLIGMMIGYSMSLGIESGRLRKRLGRALDRAEQRVSTLAVAAERERIGQDLHDILGHSLTAISVKSGLAAKLIDQDPAAAKEQMTEVEEITRVALNDVRATASNLREVRLTGEIASAKSVLLAAGIEAHTPSALPPLSDECSQLLGYAVREAVTNVVRHSEATSATIAVDESVLTITDNGIGPGGQETQPRGSGGSGLAGIGHRVDEAGGRLSIRPGEECGTVVRVVFDVSEGVPAALATSTPATTDPWTAGAVPQPAGGDVS